MIALVGNKVDLLGAPAASSSSAGASSSASTGDDDEEDDDAATTTASDTKGDAAGSSTSAITRAVPKEEAEAYAKEAGLLFFETSAKTGEGIVEVFTEIAKKIPINDILANQARNAPSAGAAAGGQPGRTASGPANGRQGAVDLNTQGQGNRDACNC